MTPVLPVRSMQSVLRDPAFLCGTSVLMALVVIFWATGALSPDEIPTYATSRREVIGMALMLIALPAYFVATAILARRHSLGLVEQLRPEIPSEAEIDAACDAIRWGWRRSWPLGLVLGLLMGAFNASIFEALEATIARPIHMSLAFGQLLLWLIVGLFFAVRLESARAFRRLGQVARLDLFTLDRLQPIARSGLADVMVIAGALAFSPLQSLDADFRWYNYHFGIGAASIFATILLLWPLIPIHRRIREAKASELARMKDVLADLPREASPDRLARLEILLAHRDRIAELGTWLLSTNLLSRFFLYLIIPPLAWVGAAIVEREVDRLLSG